MSNVMVVDTLEKLKPFLNDQNILEIVSRGKHKRIKAFQKIALNELPQVEQKELLEKVVNALNKHAEISERNVNLLGNIMKLGKIGLLLNGANLCATCTGFAIMYAKLDKMSANIAQQINQLQNAIKQGNDLQSGYEFNKAISNHINMLDCRRKQQAYNEDQMRELVDQEFNVLSLLLDVFKEGISADNEKLIFSMFSMLSMMTVSLRFFDEIYFENNHSVLGNQNVWHLAHDKWMGVYSTMTSKWFIEKLQDYAMFETKMNTFFVDVYYINLRDQVLEQKEDVQDNQELILALGDIQLLHAVKDMSDEEIRKIINSTIFEACGENSDLNVNLVFEDAFKQIGLA